MTDEEWRPVVGREGEYEVSSLGQVRGINRHIEVKGTSGPYRKFVAGQILKQQVTKVGGYSAVGIRWRHPPTKVHILVAEAFIGPRPEGLVIRHLNGNPRDNRVENLTYGTQSENLFDASRHDHRRVKRAEVQSIILAEGGARTIAKQFKVSRSYVRRVKRGEFRKAG